MLLKRFYLAYFIFWSYAKEFDSMCVCIVWIKYLGFSYFLKCCACFENNFNWHSVEDFIFVHGIVTNIEHSFHTSDSSSSFSPLVNSFCDFLDWSPVNEDSFFAFWCTVSISWMTLHRIPFMVFIRSPLILK